jgi:AraC-like DNA-binding protein
LLVLDDADVGSTRRVPLALRDHLALRLWARAAQLGADELALEERLAGLADRLLAGRREPQRVHRAVERARAYIAGNPARRDTLADIGRAAFCSPFHLARAFRRFAGQSLHGYRTQLRMRLALDRLQQGERDLNTLAADLGYASHSHFSAAFRRAFGVAPSRLRTNLTAPPLH